jgi:hypothetical protein
MNLARSLTGSAASQHWRQHPGDLLINMDGRVVNVASHVLSGDPCGNWGQVRACANR